MGAERMRRTVSPVSTERSPGVRRALASGVAAWAVAMATLLGLGLLTGVWRPGSLLEHPREVVWMALGWYLPLTLALVAAPVAASLEFRIRTPLALSVLYFGGWLVYGPFVLGIGAVRSGYVAVLYGFAPVAVFPILAGIEYAARHATRFRRGAEG